MRHCDCILSCDAHVSNAPKIEWSQALLTAFVNGVTYAWQVRATDSSGDGPHAVNLTSPRGPRNCPRSRPSRPTSGRRGSAIRSSGASEPFPAERSRAPRLRAAIFPFRSLVIDLVRDPQRRRR